MRYSNKDLTDDNFDDEYEKLVALISNLNSDEWDIYDELPKGFTEQNSTSEDGVYLGFSEWVMQGGTKPDVTGLIHGNVPQVFASGQVAFEFNNKFLSLHFNECL